MPLVCNPPNKMTASYQSKWSLKRGRCFRIPFDICNYYFCIQYLCNYNTFGIYYDRFVHLLGAHGNLQVRTLELRILSYFLQSDDLNNKHA